MTSFYSSIHQYKGKLLVIRYENGRRIKETIPYKPYLFMESADGDYKTVFGKSLEKLDFSSIYEAKEFVDKYKGVEGMNIHGFSTWPYQYIYHNFKPNEYDRKTIRVGDIDIETDVEGGYPNIETADKEITMITLSHNGQMHSFGLKPFDTSKFPNVTYYQFKNEVLMLKKFLEVWQQLCLDAITGWNIQGFDIPYIIRRITRILGEDQAKRLSPWGVIQSREIVDKFGTRTVYTILGIADFDYMELYKKFQIPLKGRPESMTLEYICQQELGVGKVDYGEYGDLGTLYKENPQLYAEYNVVDVLRVDQLDEKLKLIDIALGFAYRAGINYQDIYGTVRPWDVMIHRYLMDRKIVVPFDKITTRDFKIEGGHVKDPQCGLHRWPVSVDLTSLYPHVDIQWNISPETFVRKIEGIRSDRIMDGSIVPADYLEDNEVLAANGCVYRTDTQGFIPAIMQLLFDERKLYKKEMLNAKQQQEFAKLAAEIEKWVMAQSKFDNLQHSTKIFLNGGYGALANIYNRWFDPDNAEAITQSGQLAIKWAERAVNKKLNKILKTNNKDFVIAIDTDSLYISLEMLIDALFKDQTDKARIIAFMDKFCEDTLMPTIAKAYQELSEYVRAPVNKMDMKREALADVGIWTGKKHYILNVYNNEGVQYDTPKKKIVGIEAVRSSTAGAARKRIKTAIDVIVEGSETKLQSYVAQVRKEFDELPIDEIATPKGVSDIEKWSDKKNLFAKGCPLQVKAAIFHNLLLDQLNITNRPKIKSGEKIKYVYMDKNNPFGVPVLAFNSTMPKEFKIDQYISRRIQFEKGFLEPMKTITDAIGWNPEKTATLDAFFVD